LNESHAAVAYITRNTCLKHFLLDCEDYSFVKQRKNDHTENEFAENAWSMFANSALIIRASKLPEHKRI